VVDESKKPLPGVAIVLEAGGESTTATFTAQDGCFQFEKHIAGPYRIALRRSGFTPQDRESSTAIRADDFGRLTLQAGSLGGGETPTSKAPAPKTLPPAEANWVPRRMTFDQRYPPLAAQARITGDIIVRCTLSRAGEVVKAEAISGHPLLKEPATKIASTWAFQNASKSATLPPPPYADLIFTFELHDPPSCDRHETSFAFEYPNRIRARSSIWCPME
jgi:TonB family protein